MARVDAPGHQGAPVTPTLSQEVRGEVFLAVRLHLVTISREERGRRCLFSPAPLSRGRQAARTSGAASLADRKVAPLQRAMPAALDNG
jgi:hypothetical protein